MKILRLSLPSIHLKDAQLMTNNNNNQSNSISAEAAQVSSLTPEETRKILTPFAFEIDKSLFGLPLATPWRRGIALLIDFTVVAMLAHMSGDLLALLVAITLVKIGSRKRAEQFGQQRSLRKRFLKWLGCFIILLVLLDNVPKIIDGSFWQSNSNISVTLNDEPLVNPNTELKQESETKPQIMQDKQAAQGQEIVYKGVAWAKGFIDDLGLSFGWAAFYFSVITSIWNGQTLGKKLLGIRIVQLDGTPLSVWDSFGRYGGYGAGFATGLLGFLQIVWDPNRQAIQDKISATVVIHGPYHQAVTSETIAAVIHE